MSKRTPQSVSRSVFPLRRSRIGAVLTFAVAAGVFALTLAGAPAQATADRSELKNAMASFYSALVALVVADAKPKDTHVVDGSLLRHVADNAMLVERHFDAKMSDASYFARRLRRAATSLRTAQAKGDSEMASRAARSLVESCMQCHARQEDRVDAALTSSVVNNPNILALDDRRQARVFGALRQWDASAAAYARYFNTASANSTVAFRDDLIDFLVVEVQVKRDGKRAAAVLSKVSAMRPNDTLDRRMLDRWMMVLKKDATRTAPRSAVDACRENSETGDPSDEADLIYAVLASRDCYKVLSERRGDVERAEAYFHLADVEARLHGDRTPDRVTDLYAVSILSAPNTEIAERAYGALTQWLVRRETGSAGTQMSEETRAQLEELRPMSRRKTKEQL